MSRDTTEQAPSPQTSPDPPFSYQELARMIDNPARYRQANTSPLLLIRRLARELRDTRRERDELAKGQP